VDVTTARRGQHPRIVWTLLIALALLPAPLLAASL
jgi:hypothetical protein